MISRSILAAAGVALTGGSSVAAVDTASSGSDTSAAFALSHPVPPAVEVPAGQSLTAAFAAQGVQVYVCKTGAWTFVEPAANLIGQATKSRRIQTAVHFRGPSWESTNDGSLVTATSVGSSPVAGSIPELLLKAATNRGDGLFGKVSYIQRLSTTGGAAPAGTCTEGATTGVPYTAKYRFYSPAS
jgi:hypothetical protein